MIKNKVSQITLAPPKPKLQSKPKPNPINEIPKDRGSKREMIMPQGKLK